MSKQLISTVKINTAQSTVLLYDEKKELVKVFSGKESSIIIANILKYNKEIFVQGEQIQYNSTHAFLNILFSFTEPVSEETLLATVPLKNLEVNTHRLGKQLIKLFNTHEIYQDTHSFNSHAKIYDTQASVEMIFNALAAVRSLSDEAYFISFYKMLSSCWDENTPLNDGYRTNKILLHSFFFSEVL